MIHQTHHCYIRKAATSWVADCPCGWHTFSRYGRLAWRSAVTLAVVHLKYPAIGPAWKHSVSKVDRYANFPWSDQWALYDEDCPTKCGHPDCVGSKAMLRTHADIAQHRSMTLEQAAEAMGSRIMHTPWRAAK